MATMTPDNDANAIFELHSITEIELILSKMRNDIERKKEDLRIMVGERYRDLIEAADTISDMRGSAEAVCQNIERMEGLCESLQQRGLIGFKTRMSSSNDSSRMLGSGHQYSIAVQVKLLVDVPEILWELTERKEFLDAAQLLLLAQQAHTALQLSPNANEVLDRFPVISRQWSSISQFRSTIAKGCTSVIKNEISDLERALNAIAAMMLIEGSDMKSSLKKVFDLRRASLRSTLIAKPSTIAKTQLVNFVVHLISSFNIMYYVFVACVEKFCLLERKIREVSGEKLGAGDEAVYEAPIILLQESSLALSFLPKSVVEFRPKLHCKLETLSAEYLEAETQHWLQTVVGEAAETIAKLLSCITSMKSLSLIRNGIWEVQRTKIEEAKWSKIVTVLLGQASFSPWHTVVRKESLAQARNLIKKELCLMKEAVIVMVKSLTTEITSSSKVCLEEGDITDFLWSESISDLPDQTTWLTFNSRSSLGPTDKIGLFFKSRGYTTRLQQVCKALNNKLVLILEDLSHYSPANCQDDRDPSLRISEEEEKDSAEDYNDLLLFLENETLLVFKIFIEEVGKIAMDNFKLLEEHLDSSPDGADSSLPLPEATVIVTLSRLCQALPVVCHQIKICASASLLGNQDTAKRVSLGIQGDTKTWLDLNRHFTEKCTYLMTKHLSIVSRLFGEQLRKELIRKSAEGEEEYRPEDLLLLFPLWEQVKIEEENESGKMVESSIAVPSSPSPALLKALVQVCTSVNSVCAHTISRTSQMQLVTTLCSEINTVYEERSRNLATLNQTTALQLIFDLKLIQNILLPRENKELGSRYSSLVQKMESRVDPFDLDVLSTHISAKVKMASQRLLALIGTIIPREKQPLTIKGSTTSSGNNTLPIVPSVEIPRFSNVPLPPSAASRKASLLAPMSLESHFKGSLDLGSSGASRDSSTTAASSRTTASSIFSAMSSSWFG